LGGLVCVFPPLPPRFAVFSGIFNFFLLFSECFNFLAANFPLAAVFCSCRQNGNGPHFHSVPHYANVWRVLKSDIFYAKIANF